jgi:hypothetical protein
MTDQVLQRIFNIARERKKGKETAAQKGTREFSTTGAANVRLAANEYALVAFAVACFSIRRFRHVLVDRVWGCGNDSCHGCLELVRG